MNTLSSHTLFHFTHSLKSLQSILNNGLRFSLIAEKIPNSRLMYTVPAICFCNIPLSAIKEHLDWYGEYGIGFTPAYCKSIGATPVCYVHGASPFLPKTNKSNLFQQSRLTPFLKRTAGLQKKYNCHRYKWKVFYDEKEWRAIDGRCNIWPIDNLADMYSKQDDLKVNEKYTWSKVPNPSINGDIEYIILKERNEVPNFIQWLVNNGLKDLIPKVITVEQIMKDF